MTMECSDQELKFAEAFVRTNNASEAARIAGYKNPGQLGYRLLKRPRVIAEIQRIRDERGNRQVAKIISDANEGAAGDRGSTGDEEHRQSRAERMRVHSDVDADVHDALTRPYVIAGLVETFEVALGRRPVMVTRMMKRRTKDDKGMVVDELQAVQMELYIPDPSTANQIAKTLLEECDHKEAAGLMPGGGETDGLSERTQRLVGAIDAFRQGRAG